MAKGQIMILKDVRDVLSVSSGNRVIPVLTEKDMFETHIRDANDRLILRTAIKAKS